MSNKSNSFKFFNKPTNKSEDKEQAIVTIESTEDVVDEVKDEKLESVEIGVDMNTEGEESKTGETIQLLQVDGVVSECTRLNVRKEPSLNAEILEVITFATPLKVCPALSTDEFFKVITPSGVEGYCIKQYVNTNKNA